MQRFQELKVRQRSHALVLEIYRLSKSFPADERFGLVSQIRRAATSVATNIAEGSKRQHRSDYARFLNIAEGSLAETEYLLLLSSDLAYLPPDVGARLTEEATEIARMLWGAGERRRAAPGWRSGARRAGRESLEFVAHTGICS